MAILEYDMLFLNSAIHWIQDLDALYGKIYRSLKPGGRIMVQTGLKENNRLYETIYAMLQVKRYKPLYRSISWPWKFLTREDSIALYGQDLPMSLSSDMSIIRFFSACIHFSPKAERDCHQPRRISAGITMS